MQFEGFHEYFENSCTFLYKIFEGYWKSKDMVLTNWAMADVFLAFPSRLNVTIMKTGNIKTIM